MKEQDTKLPPGWESVVDPRGGQRYYANRSTQETRWDPPSHTSPVTSPAAKKKEPETLASLAPSNSSGTTGKSRSGSRASSENKKSKASKGTSNPSASSQVENRSLNDPLQLVAMTREMMDKAAAFPEEAVKEDLELTSLTPGQIADLCHLQRAAKSCDERTSGARISYSPLNPYRMSNAKAVPETLAARLDARIATMKRKLEEFQGDDGGPN